MLKILTKICSNCKTAKNILEFHKDKKGKFGVGSSCKQCAIERTRENYSKNKEKRLQQKQEYRDRDRDKINLDNKIRYLKNRDKYLDSRKEKNKTKEFKEKRNIYLKDKFKTDINFRLKKILRRRIYRFLKEKTGNSPVRDLGCSVEFLKQYLESKFQHGMTWENYGQWHIDHILPLSKFDLTDREQFLKACHYTNLQPLWALENILKSNKILMESSNGR